MSQQYIDYLNLVKLSNTNRISSNNATISGINEAIASFESQIDQLNSQKIDFQTNNTNLTNDNLLIDEIILLL